jgi:hypothetical protein
MSGAALRAGDPFGMAQACAVVAGLQLMPVVCRSKGAQALWLVCLAMTIVDLVACRQPMECLRAVLIHLMACVLWREVLMPDSVPEPVTLVAGDPQKAVARVPGATIH